MSERAPTHCGHGKSMAVECMHCELLYERWWLARLTERKAKTEARVAKLEAALAAQETT